MTDTSNKLHHFTLPIGTMRPEIWTRQKVLAEKLLAPSIAEVVTKVQRPFIQAITDLVSPKAAFFRGKVLLVGDALATLRPMAGLGTNQAAKNALDLVEVVEGRLGLEEWERRALAFAREARQLGLKREAMLNLSPVLEEDREL
jgi:2-polyprenyl-6-methoxyphenol hydroxylase-like FAD-dependent oxidoreductase